MKLLSLLILLTFLSCNAAKNPDINNNHQKETIISLNKEQTHNVEISITTREPYCGGAYPREEDLNKVSVGVFNYLLINTTTKDTSTVKSDVMGVIYLNLKAGGYEIREIYKDMPFSQFQEKNQPKLNQSLLGIDPDCYKKWWSENLLKFEIETSTTINKYEATIAKRCHTVRNPCITYTGRLPN